MSDKNHNQTPSTQKQEAPKAEQPKHVIVRTKSGEMVHLFTGQRFTEEAKRAPLDGFLQAQIDAGKLVVEQ